MRIASFGFGWRERVHPQLILLARLTPTSKSAALGSANDTGAGFFEIGSDFFVGERVSFAGRQPTDAKDETHEENCGLLVSGVSFSRLLNNLAHLSWGLCR